MTTTLPIRNPRGLRPAWANADVIFNPQEYHTDITSTAPNHTAIPDPFPSATTIYNFDIPDAFTDVASYTLPPQLDNA
jgi:hypothetical protein